MLRIKEVMELAEVSRRSVYNAIDNGKLPFTEMLVNHSLVRIFELEDVIRVFPKAKYRHQIAELEEQNRRLQFAYDELRKAVDSMEPQSSFRKDKI